MTNSYILIEEFNETTKLVCKDRELVVLKQILPRDKPLYETLKKIKHQNLIEVKDIIEEDGKLYAVEEYFNGQTVENYIHNNGAVDSDKTSKIAISICDGLKVLHSKGIIHRDISANNIMINSDTVKIIDFGISRKVKSNKLRDTEILGTQGYAAPEQFGFSQSSPQTDIYAVGVLINYMLTGKFPYEKKADGYWNDIITRCTQIDAEKRFQTTDDLKKSIIKKENSSRLLENIPGFYNTKKWVRVLFAIYYSSVLLSDFLMIPFDGKNVSLQLISILEFTFFALCPAFIFGDAFRWSHRLMPFKVMSRKKVIALKFLFYTLLMLIFMIIIPAES